jgi:hypothetical protein
MPQLGPFCFKNTTDVPVNGLHVIFTGTNGTLRRGKLTVGPPGRITASGNQLTIYLKGNLAPEAFLCFEVSSRSEQITVNTALWSADYNVVGRAEQLSQAVEQPS